MSNEVRTINCDCGNWEEMPVDQQRHHSQSFNHIRSYQREALYRCHICERFTVSKTEVLTD